ncbi:hypothetical protein ACWD5B_28950 [Streptomyces tanashiensis]
MTDQPARKATITLDSATSDREFPVYQLSLNAVDDDGRGHGYRLMGPKYIGRSRNLRTAELDERDANEIRGLLDEVFPVAPPTLTVEEHDRAWHAIEGAEDPDPGTILAAVLRALRINGPSAEDEMAAILRKRTA